MLELRELVSETIVFETMKGKEKTTFSSRHQFIDDEYEVELLEKSDTKEDIGEYKSDENVGEYTLDDD